MLMTESRYWVFNVQFSLNFFVCFKFVAMLGRKAHQEARDKTAGSRGDCGKLEAWVSPTWLVLP